MTQRESSWIPKWVRPKRAEPSPNPPAVPAGRRIYAIGDIHGRADLLADLHRQIAADAATAAPGTTCLAVYLGDYIDRGPESRTVIDTLLENGSLPDMAAVHLCGNHDDFLLRFLEDPASGPLWLANGGETTLESYGIEPMPPDGLPDFAQLRENLLARLPDSHRQFFRRLQYSHTEGDYFFVHAGVRPKISLDLQDPYDMMWIRQGFLDSDADFGQIVVHGHTPEKAVVERPNRIGIDTGAVFTGKLTCLVLEGADRRYLTTA